MSQRDFTDQFRTALNSNRPSAELTNISARACSSDKYDGVEYTFYGHFIPIRPIIDVIAQSEDHGIEHFAHVDEGEPRLIVFVADLSHEQPHPGFVQ